MQQNQKQKNQTHTGFAITRRTAARSATRAVQTVALLIALSGSALAQECVITLHGLARSPSSMSTMAQELSAAGYKVVNQGYDSRSDTIEALAIPTIQHAIRQCGEAENIHFVTHSLGGILVRYYFSQYPVKEGMRVVMLAPPNQGSEIVNTLGDMTLYHWINGPAGNQLGVEVSSMPNSLGPVNFDTGIIAGNESWFNPILATMMPKPNDGKVSVESTKVAGMRDHIVVEETHTFIMDDDVVIEQTLHFLRSGQFQR
uniref:esterase/lipase family protein n=1 Tax=Thaumasiovibrio occultus TaxID=1891184 RepID=UPI00131D11B4|nr:alpha/beta hydrolase [Thaumasiovibrio occultus]